MEGAYGTGEPETERAPPLGLDQCDSSLGRLRRIVATLHYPE
jgi:hypothetical protein